MNATVTSLIEECIAFETAGLAEAAPEDRHFWDGWSEEDMRAGTPVILVNVSAPGLGRISTFTYNLMIKGASGKYGSVRDVHMEKVATRKAAWRNGLEGYANQRAAALYGKDIPVVFKHLV